MGGGVYMMNLDRHHISLRLVIGGPQDRPDFELVRGFFRIEKFCAFFYVLVFCPGSSNIVGYSSSTWYNVWVDYRGLFVEKKDSGRFFMVMFYKLKLNMMDLTLA